MKLNFLLEIKLEMGKYKIFNKRISISIDYNASLIVSVDSQGQVIHIFQQYESLSQLYQFETHQDYILKVSIFANLRYLAITLTQKNKDNGKYSKCELFSTLYGNHIFTASSDLTTKIWKQIVLLFQEFCRVEQQQENNEIGFNKANYLKFIVKFNRK